MLAQKKERELRPETHSHAEAIRPRRRVDRERQYLAGPLRHPPVKSPAFPLDCSPHSAK